MKKAAKMTEAGLAATLQVPIEVYDAEPTLRTVEEHENVRIGRLFALKLKRNAEARRIAHATIRQLPNQRWQARVGGLVRGFYVIRTRRAVVEKFIDDYYNQKMFEWVSTTERSRRRA